MQMLDSGNAPSGASAETTAGTSNDAPTALEVAAREQLRAAVLAENRMSWIAAAVPFGLWLVVLRSPLLPAFGLLIVLFSIVRARAIPEIDRGNVERAVLYFLVGKWAISIALVFLLPIALPIVIVNLIMPIALASMHLSTRRFVPLVAASVVVAFVVAMLGYLQNILALEQETEAWVWQWLCVIVLTVHFLPMSLILWRGNQQQRATYDEALEANQRLVESEEDLRRSRRRLVGAADAERSRIERDLHDGAQQRLVSVLVQLRLRSRLARRGTDVDLDDLDELLDELEAAIAELRDLAHGIYPPVLAMRGLPAALSAAVRRAPIPVEIDAADVDRFDQAVEAAAYFCCLEAIQNACKHGAPDTTVTVSLRQVDDLVACSVADDGPGFDVARVATPGRGIENMTDRIGAAGGVLTIDSAVGVGTTVAFELPTAAAADLEDRRS
jgi:signal transduction histidine kinase